MNKKRLFKAAALITALSMLVTLLAGCTPDEKDLFTALMNMEPVYSYEAEGCMEFSIEVIPVAGTAGSYYSDTAEMAYRVMQAITDGAGFDYSVKSDVDKDFKNIKQEMLITPRMFGGRLTSLATGMWVDMHTDGAGGSEIIVKMPSILAALTKETAGKEYLVIDYDKLMDAASEEADVDFSSLADFGKLASDSLNMIKPISNSLLQAAALMNPDEIYVKSAKPVKDESGKPGTLYSLKITDKGFKKLVRSIINDIDKDTLKGIIMTALNGSIDYFGNFASVSDIYEDIIDELISVREAVEDGFDVGYIFAVPMINDVLDKLENIRLISPKGITFDIEVDSNGFVTMYDGAINFSVEVARLERQFNEGSSSDIRQVDFSIKMFNKMTKVNKAVNIETPALTEKNSVTFLEILEAGQSNAGFGYAQDFYELPFYDD